MEELESRVVELRESGLTQLEIADQLGTTRGKVQRILKVHGLTTPAPTRHSIDELEKKIVELKKSELTHRQIGAELGISRHTVDRILKGLGLAKPRPERISNSELKELELQIIELAKTGLANAEVAARLGIRLWYVTKTLRKEGIDKSLIRKPIREELESKVIELSRERLSNPEIGRRLGILKITAQKILKKHGLTKVLTKEYLNRTVEERLLDFLEPNSGDGCWEFQGGKWNGYGRIRAYGISWKPHRLSYSLFVGEIPEGLHVLHRCDNRKCCNPEHLFVGTNADNVADKVAKGRQHRGLTPPNKKVTPEIMDMIRKLKSEGKTTKEISNQIGVHSGTVYAWVRRYG